MGRRVKRVGREWEWLDLWLNNSTGGQEVMSFVIPWPVLNFGKSSSL